MTGAADPDDPMVIRRAAVDELYLRSRLTLAAAAADSPWPAHLTRLTDCARDSGVELVISVDAQAGAPELNAQSWLITCVEEVLRNSTGASGQLSVTMSADPDDSPAALTVVGEAATGWHLPATWPPAPPGCTVEQGEYGGWMQVSLTWRQLATGDSAPTSAVNASADLRPDR